MLTRLEWLRLRGRWVCAGLGTVCAASLAISGCSRAPMARFKAATSSTASSEADEKPSTETRQAGAERPDPRDAVARTERPPESEARVTIVGDRGNRGAMQRYREGYADLRDRVLNREQTESQDPFLSSDPTANPADFPSTDQLANPSGRVQRDALDGPVARADRHARQPAPVGVASLQRPADNAGVARTATPSKSGTSRLDQLREELRKSQVPSGAAAPFPVVADTDRGTPLAGAIIAAPSSPRSAVGFARTGGASLANSSDSSGSARPPAVAPTSSSKAPEVPASTPDVAAQGGVPATSNDLSLRVQSLLASAEWLAGQGDVEQAYRSAMLAQHLADYGHVKIAPGERDPAEVAQRIWRKAQAAGLDSRGGHLPQPRAVAGRPRAAVPADAFPSKLPLGWERSENPAALPPVEGALPVISPRGAEAGPALPAPGIAAPPSPNETTLEHVADAGVRGPVSIAGIESEPAATSPIVTALAESAADPLMPPQMSETTPTGLTLPAMASLPKTPLTLPPQMGPLLAPAAPEASAPPPYLEIAGARQLPDLASSAEGATTTRPAVVWGLAGLTAALLGCIYAFRRRWAAGSAPQPSRSDAAGKL